ncbi:MAG: M15 family metallopeptidase [Clostridia bacterium]|nr:M15 family metallopeptidase [Clostridia bacterium]
MAKKKKSSPYLAVALTLCVAAVGLAVAIAVLAISETALPPVEESSSQGVTEESDPSADESIEESVEESIAESSAPSAESSEAEISLPEESTEESVPEPEPGLGGEIPQLGSTREYESYIGLRYSVDLVQFEKYIDPENASEYLLLVSPKAPLGKDYVPDDLIYIEDMRAGRPSYYSYLREYAEKALEAFLDEAAMYGHGDIKVSNGYRSYSVQSTLFNNYLADERARHPDWTEERIYALVATYSNPPGTSEHQSGLCVDMHNQIDTNNTFDGTPAAIWLEENCYRFGFVLRYPPDKQDVTGIKYESWHFRYVGRTAATEMHELGMCLEEYLAYKGLN